MSYTGKVHNGVVVLDNGAELAEGTVVRIEAMEEPIVRQPPATGFFSIGRRAVATGQADLSTNLDHFLYGHPKVRDDRG